MEQYILTSLGGLAVIILIGILFTVAVVVCEYAYYKEASEDEEEATDTEKSA